MKIGKYLSQGMKRMGGGDWDSIQYVEKIQEMLSRAIRDQEDMWKILLSTCSTPADKLGENAGISQFGDQVQQQLEAGCNQQQQQQQQQTTCSQELVPERILRPLMGKIENSLDWCHLALCRLKEISTTTAQSPASATRLQQQACATSMPRRYPNLQATSNLTLLHAPLSALGIPRRTEDSAGSQDRDFPMSQFLGNYSRGTSSAATRADQSANGETVLGLDRSLSMLAPDLEPIQGQNFKGMMNPELGLMGTDDWPELQVDSAMEHIGAAAPLAGQCNKVVHKPVEQQQQGCTSVAFRRSLSSNVVHLKIRADESDLSCAIQDDNDDDDAPGKIPQSLPMTLKRSQSHLKRDREAAAAADGDEAVREDAMIEYQRLRPGVDTKKAIPQDGHRRWKKYGKKSIRNANFCRAYYKCSVKECNAKKTVQRTDADPSLFEVTYSGTHTCTSMSKKQKRFQLPHVPPPAVAAAACLAKVSDDLMPLDHPDQLSKITATPDQAAAAPAACHEMKLEREMASIANASRMKDGDQQEVELTGPLKPQNGVSVLYLSSTATDEAAADEDKGLGADVTAKRFSSLTELAAGPSGRHDTAEPTNSSGADLESLEAISSDSSMPGSCCHDDQSTSVDMIDTYILNTVTSNIAGGFTLHDVEGCPDLIHQDHWQLGHNAGDQANNFQDSLFDWPDLLMDNKLF